MIRKAMKVEDIEPPLDQLEIGGQVLKVFQWDQNVLGKKVDQDGPNRLLQPAMQGDVGYDISCAADVSIWPYHRPSVFKLYGKSRLLDRLIRAIAGPPPGPSFQSIPTGIHIELPAGYWAAILPRSSSNRTGLHIPFSVIDNGYRGELFPMAHNFSDQVITIKKGQRIAQLIMFPVCVFPLNRVLQLSSTQRGHNGFGSTGG